MLQSLTDGSLSAGQAALLVAALGVALGFEFVNGFHDTANAVATVIYTRSLSPRTAVIWSGLCNFAGVHLGGTAVAFAVVHLLPVELLVDVGGGAGMAMILSLLLAAIAWNLGTWWLGLPASSSHTLVGAILGVGLANAVATGGSVARGVNWSKAGEVGLSLLVSPLVGFGLAYLLLKLLKRVAPSPRLHEAPEGDAPPPGWIRAVLIGTSTGVSVAHGSNDGQKGIGLIMLILIGTMPSKFALNPGFGAAETRSAVSAAGELRSIFDRPEVSSDARLSRLGGELADLGSTLGRVSRPSSLPAADRWRARADLLRIDDDLASLAAYSAPRLSKAEARRVETCRARLRRATDFAPGWVTVAVAAALGCGTMVGWRRIVVTVGEKIGKSHLTYAQGAAAEVVAMSTIALADLGGLPVSTTHVLSSGVAGTMVAGGGGVQGKTVRNIALAWVLTLPASMALAGGLYLLLRRLAG